MASAPLSIYTAVGDARELLLLQGSWAVLLWPLAIWLWRLEPYRLAVTRPLLKGIQNLGPPPAGSNRARFALRFDLDPLDRPVRLFNSYQKPEADPTTGATPLTAPDAVGGPILPARLESTSEDASDRTAAINDMPSLR